MKTLPILAFVAASVPVALVADYNKSQIADELKSVPTPQDFSAQVKNFLSENRVAWRGERVIVRASANIPAGGKLSAALVAANGKVATNIPARAEFVRSTIGQGGNAIADIVEPAGTKFRIPAGEAPVLVSVDIPADAQPGNYALKFRAGTKLVQVAKIEILAAKLPPPTEWKIHLDLWQHPEAVARWAGTKLWSKEHFNAMKPVMQRLADAGQKTITCSIIEEPWGHQTYDHWTSMIKWTKTRSGKWKFDYTPFDKYVEFMMNEIGIKEQISCYTMVSWSLEAAYFDEATGTQKKVSIKPGAPEYESVWKAFLTDFKAHVKGKGWLDKTCIALDERPDELVNGARDLIKKYAPELKIVSAVDRPTKMSPFVYDISPTFNHSNGIAKLIDERRKENKKTTFYVCTSPAKPNTFPHSAPAESHWLGLYSAANNFDGFLRWAYNSWVENPFMDCRWPKRSWPAGDCFLVYPGNRTTLRFETLRDGFEDFEKINILRERSKKSGASSALKNAVKELNNYLTETFTVKNGGGNEQAEQVLKARELIDAASKKIK